MFVAGRPGLAQPLELAINGSSVYSICYPQKPSPAELKGAGILQQYFHGVTGVLIPVGPENKNTRKGHTFYIGATASAAIMFARAAALPDDGFRIWSRQQDILIAGSGDKGTLYGVYEFIEKYMGCRKWDAGAAFVPRVPNLRIPAIIRETCSPVIRYREVYLPAAFDDEYADWHKLHRFEEKWGWWGHSFFKLVPPETYYFAHPEYFSLVNRERKPLQLCLSNADVLQVTIAKLTELMKDNPAALYWSVSPNDDAGNCECDNCRMLDDMAGGPQGSLIRFVNAVAARFPGKIITTLAYGYSAKAPAGLHAAPNVAVILSSIDAQRGRPLQAEPTAADFRANLARWRQKTSRLFVWDYCTQFTNYLTPFPVTANFSADIRFFEQQGITGVFAQGSGDTYSDMAELKAYVAAGLLWNPALDADSLVRDFLRGYYGKAAPVIAAYLSLLQKNIAADGYRLDIYGNPVNDHTGYLSPENMDAYSRQMDQAEEQADDDTIVLRHIRAIRLSQEYVYLQQARFYGKERHGLFSQADDGAFVVRPGLAQRIERFTRMCADAGAKELAEEGVSPALYAAEWKSILLDGPKNNLAAGAGVSLAYPYASEYPAKGVRTLVDETPGYRDFSYNWLCFYGVPMEATIDMGTVKKVAAITVHFLQDARHRIFSPATIRAEGSVDGLNYQVLQVIDNEMMEENYTVSSVAFRLAVDASIRYIRVKADNWSALPAWRYHKYKKPTIACDEIWVE